MTTLTKEQELRKKIKILTSKCATKDHYIKKLEETLQESRARAYKYRKTALHLLEKVQSLRNTVGMEYLQCDYCGEDHVEAVCSLRIE